MNTLVNSNYLPKGLIPLPLPRGISFVRNNLFKYNSLVNCRLGKMYMIGEAVYGRGRASWKTTVWRFDDRGKDVVPKFLMKSQIKTSETSWEMNILLFYIPVLSKPSSNLCLTLFHTFFLEIFLTQKIEAPLGPLFFLRLLFGFVLLKCVKKSSRRE